MIDSIYSASGYADGTDIEVASTHRNTPDGLVPGGVAGYIVGECMVLCADCGRDHPDVHSHPDDTPLHGYDYDYIEAMGEWDYGAFCEECGRLLDTNVIVYDPTELPENHPDNPIEG